jgi:glycosyltransferase involved in cell wall biosynthesis
LREPVRLSVVMTHPIQYYAPWFRYIAETVPEIRLKAHYCVIPTPEQQGVGFEEPFTWDASLLDGYDHVILRKPSHKVTIHSSSFFGVTVPEIAASVRSANPDVVLVPGWYSISFIIAALSARLGGIPILYRGDSQLTTRWEYVSTAKRVRTQTILRMFTHFLSVGKRNHEFLRNYSIPESNIFFSPHCVDNEFFQQSASRIDPRAARQALGVAPESFVVLLAGPRERKKRPWEVIEAADKMDRPPVVLIAGSGEAEQRCRAAAATGKADVRFLGFQNQSEIARLYGMVDALVLPSDSGETWGMVVNEALAAGVPCVVTDRVGCGPDLIQEGKTGFVIPFKDTGAQARALRHIRAGVEEGKDFSESCRARVAEYSFETATAGLKAAVFSAAGRVVRIRQ